MRIIIIFLILSILYSFTACYNTKLVSLNDEIKNLPRKEDSFYLYTKNSKSYYFRPYYYRLINDRLVGSAQVVTDGIKGSSEFVSIAVEDIHKLEVEELDGIRSIVALTCVVGIGYCTYLFIEAGRKLNNGFLK